MITIPKNIFGGGFFKNSLIFTLSNVLSKSVPFFLLPLMTSYLSPDDYGKYSMFLVLYTLLMPLTGLNANSVLIQKYFYLSDSEKRDFMGDTYKIIIGMVLLLSIVFFIGRNYIQRYVQLDTVFIILAVISAGFSMVNSMTLTVIQIEKRATAFAVINFVKVLLESSFSIYLVVLIKLAADGRIDAIIITSFIYLCFSIYWNNRYRYHNKLFSKPSLQFKSIMKLGAALIPTTLTSWTSMMSDRIFLSNMLSLREVGIYSVGVNFAQVSDLVASSVGRAWFPVFLEKLSKKKGK